MNTSNWENSPIQHSVKTSKIHNQVASQLPKIAAKAPGVIYQFICHEYEGVTFSFISPSCSKVFELKASEIQADAQRLISLIHPEDVESFYNSLAVASKTLKTWQWEGRFILPSGQVKYIYASSEPEQQPNGEIIWDGLLMDITHRLHAESQLQAEIIERQRVETELTKQKEFIGSIYDGVEHLIFLVDVLEDGDLHWIAWNLPTERAVGKTTADIANKPPEEIFGATEGAAVRQRFIKCLEVGHSITYEECLTFHEQETWWLTTLNPLKDSFGKIYRVVGTTFNISDRVQAEKDNSTKYL
ncbi:MAG: PAS domain-containing protein [Heteroscytonema crispum UTEX LB 1556]